MRRNVEIGEISDGKFYSSNDMAKLSCSGCGGCCRGMGHSVILDPWDIWEMTRNLGVTFDDLLSEAVELQVVDGVILPNLKMIGQGESCFFLSSENRCRIHKFRPGVCRLFPLGRYYQGNTFQYIVQKGECHHPAKIKEKIHKWIGIPSLRLYEKYIREWHAFLKEAENAVERLKDPQSTKNLCLYILNQFYRKPYGAERDFYAQFEERLREAKALLALEN